MRFGLPAAKDPSLRWGDVRGSRSIGPHELPYSVTLPPVPPRRVIDFTTLPCRTFT